MCLCDLQQVNATILVPRHATVGQCKLHDQQSTADARWNLCYEVSI
jgi:hypothetical protein